MCADNARALATAVEARTLEGAPALAETPKALFRAIRDCLITATDEGVLAGGPERVYALVKLAQAADRRDSQVAEIWAGESLDKGQDSREFLFRSDGARMSFAVTMTSRGKSLALVAYRFNLRFPDGVNLGFVRFDLNSESGDPLLEPRCHVHIGADDLRAATPLMSPLEILTKLLYGLPRPDE